TLLSPEDPGVSDPVVLTLATAPTHLLVADCIAADRFALLGAGDIGQLPVTHGGRRALLGDFFTVTGERSATVRITGDVTKVEGIGAGMADGELVALVAIDRPATFRYACTYRPPHLPLLLRYLRARYALAIGEPQITGRYARYSGDLAELGKGEILHWVAE